MKVDVFAVYTEISERDLRDRTVVVIDLLRATTTMATAMTNGAKKIIPVADVEDAIALSRTLDKKEALLCGERNALPLPGFDLGNSPLEYTREAVEGKTVVITTTNGAYALNAVKNADRVYLGALANRSALVRKLVELGTDVCIVCAGTKERFSADDVYTAGAVINGLRALGANIEANDLGVVAELLYVSDYGNLNAIRSTHHYNVLMGIGLEADLQFCFTEDTTDVVPQFKNGVIEQ